MKRFLGIVGAVLLLGSAVFSAEIPGQTVNGSAPGGPGTSGAWARPDKEGFLATLQTNVWATIAGGILTEVYYPTVDRAQTRDTQVLFVMGSALLEERKDFRHEVKRYENTLAYHVTSFSQAAGIRIEKDIYLDPVRPAVVLNYDITFAGAVPERIYFMHNPAADNSHGGDGIAVSTSPTEMYAMQTDRRGDEPPVFQTRSIQYLTLDVQAVDAAAGFEGINDPWTQLSKAGKFISSYDSANNGNVAGAFAIPVGTNHIRFKAALSFAPDSPSALEKLRATSIMSIKTPTTDALHAQAGEWFRYLARLNQVGQAQSVHVMILKALEDKTYKGALIAAPSLPSLPKSVEAVEDNYELARLRKGDSNGGYHRIWPRDLFQMALAFLSVGDMATAVDIATYMKRIQLTTRFMPRFAGTFPQNTWVDGQMSWGGFQIDQTGFPIILVARLMELDAIRYEDFRAMVRSAADALVQLGPWTMQDRWEENKGLSPNSIAVACEGLLSAAWLEKDLDPDRAQVYGDTCKKWEDSIFSMTFTTNGPLGGSYFERLEVGDQTIDPNDDGTIFIHNEPVNGQVFLEKEIIDGGFIQWIISGLFPGNEEHLTSSLAVYDRVARTPLRSGAVGYMRYNNDGYGLNHQGGGWPLLSGERALAALVRGEPVGDHARALIDAVSPAGIICEQAGMSACPLGWAHAEVLIVARSLAEKKSFYIPRRWLHTQN